MAILDIHILRAGFLGKFFDTKLTVERRYLELQYQFFIFSKGLGVRASELDFLMWLQMMSSNARYKSSEWKIIRLTQAPAAILRRARSTPASFS